MAHSAPSSGRVRARIVGDREAANVNGPRPVRARFVVNVGATAATPSGLPPKFLAPPNPLLVR